MLYIFLTHFMSAFWKTFLSSMFIEGLMLGSIYLPISQPLKELCHGNTTKKTSSVYDCTVDVEYNSHLVVVITLP